MVSLDIIRCVALFCVIAVHFFLKTGFYNEPVDDLSMFGMIIMRNSFMICVPLFMLLTGYLIHNADISLKYYIKLVRVLFVYVLASLFCGTYTICVIKDGMSFSRCNCQYILF